MYSTCCLLFESGNCQTDAVSNYSARNLASYDMGLVLFGYTYCILSPHCSSV